MGLVVVVAPLPDDGQVLAVGLVVDDLVVVMAKPLDCGHRRRFSTPLSQHVDGSTTAYQECRVLVPLGWVAVANLKSAADRV